MPTKDGRKLFKRDIKFLEKRQSDYIQHISTLILEKDFYSSNNLEVPLLLDFNIQYFTNLLNQVEITLLENELGFLNKVG